MEKENTAKTGEEKKEGMNWEGCQCGCGDMPVQGEKGAAFMGGGCGCMPEDMAKMFKDCCSGTAMPEAMKEKMKAFFQGKSS